MPHIHTKPGDHDHTASAYVYRLDGDEPRLILHFHRKLHKYMQYGGHIELNETPWQAIVHELREESGYEMSQLKILQPKQRMNPLKNRKLHPYPLYQLTHDIDTGDIVGPHFHTDIAYAFITKEEPHLAISEAESSKLKLLTRDELAKMNMNETTESVRAAGLFGFDVCLKQWEAVDPAEFN